MAGTTGMALTDSLVTSPWIVLAWGGITAIRSIPRCQ